MNIEIISEKEYQTIYNNNKYHFDKLIEIVKDSGETLEGNCMYQHQTFFQHPQLIPKQRNLVSIARTGNNIIEIGFNAGHSALLLLLANPNAFIHCFDNCSHSYTKKCFDYLCQNFNNRLRLYIGNSLETLPEFAELIPNQTYDILHIDGSHDVNIAEKDLQACLKLSHKNSIIIFDDIWLQVINNIWKKYITNGTISEFHLLQTPLYSHGLGYVLEK